MAENANIDPATQQMIDRAAELGVETVWDRTKTQEKHCKFGTMGVCCKNCNLGPCRLGLTTEKGAQTGVCGADREIIASRNLLRHAAAGSACHNDHGRDMSFVLENFGKGKTQGYTVKAPEHLRKVATEWGVEVKDRSDEDIATDLAGKFLAEFGKQRGGLTCTKRAPKARQEVWKKLGIAPEGIDREVTEAISRTNIGVDNDYKGLIDATMKVSLSDGWGGSMIATDITDILFGMPEPIRAEANLGVLDEKKVNIIIHGHVPLLPDVLVDVSQKKELTDLAAAKGAEGINIVGLCCTANEILIRRGVPVAGNFLQQELAIITGAVEMMLVDIQCIMPSLGKVADCFHTKVISTHEKARYPGVEHVQFDETKAVDICEGLIKDAIENFGERDADKVMIPSHKNKMVVGFTTENVFHKLGGKYRGSYRPLNDAIINGRIRGVAGVVGCDNTKNESGAGHIAMVKELLANDILVVQTGCSAVACGKAGLLTPEAAQVHAGLGLREVCETVGIPPVLYSGACVDNSRILTECTEMVLEGGLGDDISDLPVAGAAPEWMSEKAMAIGWYAVASGLLVVFGTSMPVLGSEIVTKYITEDLFDIVGGAWAFEEDAKKAAHIMIDHINSKREKLKLKPMLNEPIEVK